jgi:undecaprenyl-diphosphatase
MNTIFIFGAKYLFLVSIIIGIILFIKLPKTKRTSASVFGMLSLVLTFVLGKLASVIYYNPRPFVSEHITPLVAHAPDNGFPSDHTLLVASIASIVWFYNKKAGVVLWVIALFVAVSRVFVGVHHTVDVVASMLIALLATYVVHIIQKRRLNDRI